MTPLFVGSEPVIAESGKFKGTAIMQREQDNGLALIRSLSPEQQARAIIETSKDGNDNLGEAFSDNIVLDYAGIPAAELSAKARERLLDLIGLYVHNHARRPRQGADGGGRGPPGRDPLRLDRRHRTRPPSSTTASTARSS